MIIIQNKNFNFSLSCLQLKPIKWAKSMNLLPKRNQRKFIYQNSTPNIDSLFQKLFLIIKTFTGLTLSKKIKKEQTYSKMMKMKN